MDLPQNAYEAAQLIHEIILSNKDTITGEELAVYGLARSYANIRGVEQVDWVGGNNPRQPSYESLSRNNSGLYVFNAIPGPNYVGDQTLGRHTLTPGGNEDMDARFAHSMIAQKFTELAIDL